jgi:A/G-specific adenine glycosylase
MMLLAMIGREWSHAVLRMPGRGIISCLRGAVNGMAADFAGSAPTMLSIPCVPRFTMPHREMKLIRQHSDRPELNFSLFRERLLAWYDAHARALPWRVRPGKGKPGDRYCIDRSRVDHYHIDPYRIWVSEIMLQQTRVAAVIEHYHEFLRRFPTVEKLAAAREASVLAAWSGLGYYRRARMLRAGAKLVVREGGGKFPETAEGWRGLPGIGRYTAGAIASIAFGEPVAVVDGNVERVLQRFSGRLLACEELWDAAERLLDRECPGEFNQAMMELGATVCTPRAPACLTCPVMELCVTRGELNGTARAEKQKKREIHYALHSRHGAGRALEVFLVQRPRGQSLMAGMWELPEARRPTDHVTPAFTVRHSITVTDYTVHVWHTSVPDSRGRWIADERLGKVALTGLARKILRKAKII